MAALKILEKDPSLDVVLLDIRDESQVDLRPGVLGFGQEVRDLLLKCLEELKRSPQFGSNYCFHHQTKLNDRQKNSEKSIKKIQKHLEGKGHIGGKKWVLQTDVIQRILMRFLETKDNVSFKLGVDRNLNVDCFGAAAASIQDGDNNEIVQAATVIDATGSAGRVARSFFESAMPIGAKSPARREDIHSHQGVHAASNVTIVESGAHRDSTQWPSIGAAKRFFVGIGLLDDGYMLNRSDGLKNHTMVGKKWICRKVDEKINQVNHPVIRQKAIYESHNEEILKVSGGKYSIAPFQSFGVRDFIAQLKHIGLTDASISSFKIWEC